MYCIELSSGFEELWRYNLLVTCRGLDNDDNELYVTGDEKVTSETFQSDLIKLPAPPEDFKPEDLTLMLKCEDAPRIDIIAYVVAHTLPENRRVEDSPPFYLRVQVTRNEEEIYDELHEVNQWGGLSAYIDLT